MASKKLNRKKDFEHYMKKWGMENYFLYAPATRNIFIVENCNKAKSNAYGGRNAYMIEQYSKSNCIITNLNAFFKRATNSSFNVIELVEYSGRTRFESLDELKRHMLFKKLAGI